MRNNNENLIVNPTLEIAFEIFEYTELRKEHEMYVIEKQLLKSGTSIGANVRETQSAESKSDFIQKMKIAAKEAVETEYLLILCDQLKNYPENETLKVKFQSIIFELSKIISSTKRI